MPPPTSSIALWAGPWRQQTLPLSTAKLSPKDVFELLKDKWDDLREVSSSVLSYVLCLFSGVEGPLIT